MTEKRDVSKMVDAVLDALDKPLSALAARIRALEVQAAEPPPPPHKSTSFSDMARKNLGEEDMKRPASRIELCACVDAIVETIKDLQVRVGARAAEPMVPAGRSEEP